MKKSLKLLMLLLCLFLAGTVLLTGCGNSGSNAGGNTGVTDPAQIKGTITYWCNQDWADANEELVADFQAQYPNIKVNMTPFPYDTLIEKLRASYAGKQESDVQQIFGDWAIDLMKNGLIDKLPEDLANDIKSRYYEAPLGGYTYEGNLYGIPQEFNLENGGVLYYPEDLKSVGYTEFPKTFEELMDAAKKLAKQDANGNVTHLGFDFVSFDNVPYTFLSFILQQGGDYWDQDKVHVTFSTPEAEKAMQTLVDMVVKDKITEIKHYSDMNNESQVMFFKGLSSMCIRGPWVIPAGKNDFGVENFEYGTMPSFTGDSQAFAAESGWGLVVSSRSKNKDAAWLFVRFMTNKENSEKFNLLTYTVPADKTIAESPEFVENQPMLKTSLDVLKYGVPIGPLQSIDTFKTIVGNHFISMCSGEEGVTEGLKLMENEINKMIDERLAQ